MPPFHVTNWRQMVATPPVGLRVSLTSLRCLIAPGISYRIVGRTCYHGPPLYHITFSARVFAGLFQILQLIVLVV